MSAEKHTVTETKLIRWVDNGVDTITIRIPAVHVADALFNEEARAELDMLRGENARLRRELTTARAELVRSESRAFCAARRLDEARKALG